MHERGCPRIGRPLFVWGAVNEPPPTERRSRMQTIRKIVTRRVFSRAKGWEDVALHVKLVLDDATAPFMKEDEPLLFL